MILRVPRFSRVISTEKAGQIRYGIELARFAAPLGFHSEDGKKFAALHGTDTKLNTAFKKAFYFTSRNIDKRAT